MATCENAEKCIFFNDKMKNIPAIAEMMKKRYCMNDNTNCARYIISKAKGKIAVPEDLFPGDIERARKIIGS